VTLMIEPGKCSIFGSGRVSQRILPAVQSNCLHAPIPSILDK
jgi:hypothetical protein